MSAQDIVLRMTCAGGQLVWIRCLTYNYFARDLHYTRSFQGCRCTPRAKWCHPGIRANTHIRPINFLCFFGAAGGGGKATWDGKSSPGFAHMLSFMTTHFGHSLWKDSIFQGKSDIRYFMTPHFFVYSEYSLQAYSLFV